VGQLFCPGSIDGLFGDDEDFADCEGAGAQSVTVLIGAVHQVV
jgi:hypothetical protein